MSSALIVPAFIAGILTFLAPCTLPLVPGFLAFISGVEPDELDSSNDVVSRKAHRKIFINGLLYTIGFSLVFIAFGSLFGLGGAALFRYRALLAQLGGIIVILFGLYLIFGAKIPFLKFMESEKRIHASTLLKPGTPGSSFLFGAVFALGWTPCIGPILGSVLLLASSAATLISGAFLLFVFSLGLAIPFLILAATISSATLYIKKINKYLGAISTIGGVFLVFIGILLVTGSIDAFNGFIFQLFDGLGYDRLLDYL